MKAKRKVTTRLYTFTVEIQYTGDGDKPLPQTLHDIIVSRLGEYGHFPGQYSVVRVNKRTTVFLRNKVLLRVKSARKRKTP